MNKIIGIFSTAVVVLAFSINPAIADEATISDEKKAEINSVCQDESKEANYPQEYFEECVAEKLQAMKDEQQDAKDPT